MSRSVPLAFAAFVSCASLPLLSGTAAAQGAFEDSLYINCEYRFATLFLSPPLIRDISYTTHNGASIPARQFYNERGQDRFSVTVVKFPDGPAVDEQAVEHAAENLRRRGEVRFQAAMIYDPGMPGRTLNILEAGGRQLRASVYMAEGHLTITEASAALGDFNALLFEQSITLIDGQGYDRDQNSGQELKRYGCR